MDADKLVFKGVNLRQDQIDFINGELEEGEKFTLSLFIRRKLDDWIRFRKEVYEFKNELKNGKR